MKPLNPIMAVLAIASVGALPLRALAADGTTTVTVPAGVPVADDQNSPIVRLTEALSKNSAAKADAAQRVADFLLLPDAAKKSFVASDVGAKELRAVAVGWAGEQKPGDLAMLYFVAGVGDKAPDWVKNDPVLSKTVMPKRGAEDRLRGALSRFTEGAQIKKAKEKDDSVAFLYTASAEAKKIFDDPRSKPEVDMSVEVNNNTGVKAPDTTAGSGSSSRLSATSQQYTLQDLYIDGAVVADVSGPKDPNSRRISMKIYTRRDPESGELVNEIGIFDISDKNNIYGQRFSLTGGDQSFVLDDRTPGHKKYNLTFKTLENGEQQVTFARPGDGGVKLTTTVKDLFLNRADQAADLKNVVNVGGKDFYVVPQGGAMGALAMFPKDLIDSRRSEGVNPRTLKPGLYAEVSKRGPEGVNQNVPPGERGGPHLGRVGGKDYKLVFNDSLGVWEVQEGAGNLPPKPSKPAPAGGGNPGDGGGNPAGGGEPAGSRSVEELETLLLKLPECKKNPEDTAKLAEGLKGKFGLITCNKTNKPEDLEVFVLVPASVRKEQQLKYGRIEAQEKVPAMNLLRGRFLDHYLVLQFDKQVHYLDLAKPAASGFEVAGFVVDGATGDDSKSGFKDLVPFMDALRNYVKATGQDTKAFDEVPGRVNSLLGGKFTYIKATFRNGTELVVGGAANGTGFEVWPEAKVYGGSGTSTAQYQSLSGPANAMDGSVGSVDAPLLPEITLEKSMKGVAKFRTADIAIYKAVDPTGKIADPNQYFVMFRYDALDPTEKKTFRQKQFEVFNSSNPLPSEIGYQGLVGQTVIKDRVSAGYRFVSGTNKDKGVLAVFQEKQAAGENVKDKPANCVGPIIWWGLKDREEALAACKEDKL